MESRTILSANISELSPLFHSLEKLVVLHRSLIDALKLEYTQMSAMDTKGLHESAQTKEFLISEIWNYEQLRIKAAEKIKQNTPSLEKKVDVTLQNISEFFSKTDSDKLLQYRSVLQMLVDEAKALNKKNAEFVIGSLERIEQMKRNVLGLGNNTKENYSNEGVRHPITEQGGRFLTTEA